MQKTFAESYLLHTQPFKETSLIIRMFGKNQGRFSVIAKGIKRKQSQALRAILQPFNLLQIEYTGKNDLKTLCNAELKETQLAQSNRTVACSYYLNELLLRSTQEWQEFPELFDHYGCSLRLLQKSDKQAEILRSFEVALLTNLGVAPSWTDDIDGKTINPTSKYHYINEQGFSEVSGSKDNVAILKNKDSHNQYFSGASIAALGTGHYQEDSLKDCQRITQMLLRKIIGNKPLESRKLWL